MGFGFWILGLGVRSEVICLKTEAAFASAETSLNVLTSLESSTVHPELPGRCVTGV